MKINKILVGLLVAGVCGTGLTVMASKHNRAVDNRKPIEVKPVESSSTTSVNNETFNGGNVTREEVEKYIVSKYGENWAADLSAKYGDKWDDILENELENYFGYKYDNLIDNVIGAKEHEIGLDYYDDIYDDDRKYIEDKNEKRDEIEKYIVSKYGENWAEDLASKNGYNWDDKLEKELEKQYGKQYDEIIENIIEAKEHKSGLDLDDKYDFFDDLDDHYDND